MAIAPQFGSIVPSQQQQTLANNYLNFTGGQNNFLAMVSKVSISKSVIRIISTIFKTEIELQKINQTLITLLGSS